jgi:hypothetical protein
MLGVEVIKIPPNLYTKLNALFAARTLSIRFAAY